MIEKLLEILNQRGQQFHEATIKVVYQKKIDFHHCSDCKDTIPGILFRKTCNFLMTSCNQFRQGGNIKVTVKDLVNI